MKRRIACFIDVSSEKNDFSLDELIVVVAKVIKEEGVAGIVSLLLENTDRELCDSMIGKSNKENPEKPCCKEPYFERCSSEPRRIDTSVGRLKFHCTRLRCRNCKKSFVPIKDFFKIKPYTSHSLELELVACETVSHQSYRRSAKLITQAGLVPIGKSKIHSWVMVTESVNLKLKQSNLQTIIADGTGYPRFKTKAQKEYEKQNPKRDTDNRPLEQIRVILGIDKDGKTIPMGVFNEETWAQIGRMTKRANQNEKLLPKPIAEVLVSDGEIALERGLGKLAKTHQRCQWHLTHDLKSVMQYRDEANQETVLKTKEKIREIMNVRVPNKKHTETTEQEKLELEAQIMKAEIEMENLVKELKSKQYFETATYVSNAKSSLFTYIKIWIRTGNAPPKVSSQIERAMREIKLRLKRIGCNWSAKGAAKMTKMILKRFTNANEWGQYWNEALKLQGKIEAKYVGVQFVN